MKPPDEARQWMRDAVEELRAGRAQHAAAVLASPPEDREDDDDDDEIA